MKPLLRALGRSRCISATVQPFGLSNLSNGNFENREFHTLSALQGEAGYRCSLAGGSDVCSPRLVVATGGLSFPAVGTDGTGHRLLRGLGHSLKQLYPALTPLLGPHPGGQQLAGARVSAACSRGACFQKFFSTDMWEMFSVWGPAPALGSRWGACSHAHICWLHCAPACRRSYLQCNLQDLGSLTSQLLRAGVSTPLLPLLMPARPQAFRCNFQARRDSRPSN